MDGNQVAHTTWPTIYKYLGLNIWGYAVHDMMRRAPFLYVIVDAMHVHTSYTSIYMDNDGDV